MWHRNFRIDILWQKRKKIEFWKLKGTMIVIIDICLGLVYWPYNYIKFHWLCIEGECASSLWILADPVWTGYVREESTDCASYWYSFNKRMQLKRDLKYLIVPVSRSGPSTTKCTKLFSLLLRSVCRPLCMHIWYEVLRIIFQNYFCSSSVRSTYREILNKSKMNA